MAFNKLEKHIKRSLNERTLQPSPETWDTLSQRLDNQTEKHKNKSYWWLGLAASIVGVLLVTTLFNNNDNSMDSSPIMVNNPKPIKELMQDSVQAPDFNKNKKIVKDVKTDKKEVFVVTKSDTQTLEIKKETIKTTDVIAKELTFKEQKIQEVVAQIHILKDNHTDVHESEIDVLLLNAQKEINLNQLYNNNKVLVDAASLLQDAEADIDQSFRSKVFEALKERFGTIKSAIVNHNN